MAENRIKKSDIAEEDVFAYVGQSAEKNLAKIIALDNQLRKTTETLAGLGRGTNTETLAGINQLVLTQKELDVVVKQAIETDKQKLITEKALEKQRLADIKLQQEREKSIDRYNAKLEKERQAEEKLASVYNKVQSKLSGMKKEYRDLAVRKELGAKLTDQEAKRYDFLAGKIQTYDTALKTTDASMGQHFRNVGNYAGAWNGLGNSVSQLAREMPAFANSMQTGFMAISNNLPIFFDEVKKINDQNKVLKANGEQTTSAFKQVAGSIFSLSTGLSIGVTLLTVYGAKLFEYVSGLFNAKNAVNEYKNAQKVNNEQQKKANDYVAENSAELVQNLMHLKNTNSGSKERSKLIKEINEKYGTHIQNLKDEGKFQAQINQTVLDYIAYQKQRFKIQQYENLTEANLKKQSELNQKIYAENKNLKKIQDEISRIELAGGAGQGGWATLNTELRNSKELLNGWKNELKEADKRLLNYGWATHVASEAANSYGFEVGNTTTATDKQNESLKTTNEYLDKQLKLKNDLAQIDLQTLQSTLDEEINQLTENMLRDVRETGELDVDYLEQLINDRFALEQYYRDQLRLMNISEVEDKYKAETEAERKALQEKYDAIIKEHTTLTKEQQAEYDNEQKIIAENEKKRLKDLALEVEAINKKSAQEEVKIEEDRNAKINEVNDTLIEGQIEHANKKNDLTKKEIDDLKKAEKEKRDIIQKYGDEIIDGFIDRSKERERILNRELDASRKQEDYLRQLAINGNADAKQSLAAQENVSKEKQRLADQENRRQQQLEEAKMVYKSILQFMDKGDSLPEATAKGIAGTLGIRKLIASLPGFYKGTKGTIADELGSPMLQGKDGYVVRVDGSEKVLNPELSRMTGTATTDEIVNGYLMARNMQNVLVPVSSGVTSQNEYDMLTKELRDLKHTIKNKRELHFSEDVKMGIARGLIVTEKQGLTRTRTTYRP